MWTTTQTPIGPLRIVEDNDGITAVEFSPFTIERPLDGRDDANPLLVETVEQLAAYFAGRLREFHVPVWLTGTPFQTQVWHAIGKIGYGRTLSYGQVAAAIGYPSSSRAVGQAAGRNPVPVIVGCHRVLGVTGALTGYAGGADRKQLLLGLEERARVA